MSVELELPYPSQSGNHHTRGKAGGGRYLTKDALAYRAAVAEAVRGRRAPAGAVSCAWLIAPPDERARDTDNLMKVVKDALTHARFWVDDSSRVIPSGSWQWATPMPGGLISITVSSLN